MRLPDVIPFADVVDIDWRYDTPLTRLDGVVAHIAVSNAARPTYLTGTKAHGYVRKDGVLVQDVSLRMQSGACRQGNPRLWTFETQGGLDEGDRNDGEWTDAQIATLARLHRFSNEYGVPLRLMESSQPTERGLGWHRLGIDGNFPTVGLQRGRGQRGGGESWSKSRGKECPGNARINQMPAILALAKNGSTPITPTPVQEDDMYKDDPELRARLDQIVGWQQSWFKALEDQAENNRNLLAEWTQNRTREAVTASTAAILSELPELDLSQERIDELVGGAVDRALADKTIPVSGKIEIEVPTLSLGERES